MNFINETSCLILRGVQAIFSIIALGTAAGSEARGSYSQVEFSLAISVISFVYIITVISPIYKFIVPLAAIILEGILVILWLVAFALMADTWGSDSCSYSLSNYHFEISGCPTAKANIAFAFLTWILYIVSLVFMVIFSIIPALKNDKLVATNYFAIGAILPGDGSFTGANFSFGNKKNIDEEALDQTIEESKSEDQTVNAPVDSEPQAKVENVTENAK